MGRRSDKVFSVAFQILAIGYSFVTTDTSYLLAVILEKKLLDSYFVSFYFSTFVCVVAVQ